MSFLKVKSVISFEPVSYVLYDSFDRQWTICKCLISNIIDNVPYDLQVNITVCIGRVSNIISNSTVSNLFVFDSLVC